ncbi:sugar phosphate isomerase/epimerase family protein [Fictibacillus gelatini]|uniref:sugar phosphate isomerase/epimerase family protein n=1 Tax=Fictibacillus gelatini TaxID=225985 RepID=UPI0004190D29|nr:sugar phosphate isomerase/epimerase family protein [Fictibacillus gelatini]
MPLKKGINAWCFPAGTEVERIFHLAKEYGYDGVELNLSEDGQSPIHMESTEESLLKVVDLAKEYSLELPSISTALHWKYALTDNDQSLREKGKEVVGKMVEAASIIGAKHVLVVPGLVSDVVSYDVAYERSLAAFKELAEVAEEKKVHIGVENVWNKFLLSPLEMRNFIDEVASGWVGVYFDVGNVLQFGFPEQWIKILGKRICAVHVKDFSRAVGNINGFVPLLAGDVAWEEVIQALEEIGYDGYITPELSPYQYNPEQLIRHTSHSLDTILKLEKHTV